MIRSDDVIYPTVIIDDVSVKRSPKRLTNFSFSGIRLIGRAPLIVTVTFASVFTGLQLLEYLDARFHVSDSVYGCCF